MKKRAMKKWIPKQTLYCDGCKWYKFLGIKKHDKNNCEFANECNICEECKTHIMKCEYLNFIDDEDETLLWDGCKECGVQDYFMIKHKIKV